MLIAELTSGLRRRCRTLFDNWQVANDAAREAWIKAWKSRRMLKQDGAFKTCPFRIARNACLDRVRSPQV
ncbi:RNA polymerase sigma factor [Glutamicibacter sp.]|uniref:RNA polymerase sigma factor n=1 Tax=Glutamicibacter sp. TaxID=1931995 RepID=UPI0039C868E8